MVLGIKVELVTGIELIQHPILYFGYPRARVTHEVSQHFPTQQSLFFSPQPAVQGPFPSHEPQVYFLSSQHTPGHDIQEGPVNSFIPATGYRETLQGTTLSF